MLLNSNLRIKNIIPRECALSGMRWKKVDICVFACVWRVYIYVRIRLREREEDRNMRMVRNIIMRSEEVMPYVFLGLRCTLNVHVKRSPTMNAFLCVCVCVSQLMVRREEKRRGTDYLKWSSKQPIPSLMAIANTHEMCIKRKRKGERERCSISDTIAFGSFSMYENSYKLRVWSSFAESEFACMHIFLFLFLFRFHWKSKAKVFLISRSIQVKKTLNACVWEFWGYMRITTNSIRFFYLDLPFNFQHILSFFLSLSLSIAWKPFGFDL